MIGGGAVDTRAGGVTEFAELLGAGVVPSNAGKGIVPDSHPLNLGTSMVKEATRAFVTECDVVLAIGTELAETDSYVEWLPINGKLIRVDIDASKINDLYPADIGIVADAGRSLDALLGLVKAAHPTPREDAAERVAAARRRRRAELDPLERIHQSMWDAIRAGLPDDAAIFADMTQLAYTGTFAMPVERPRTWFHAAGYCTLGCAMPMAIGAKVAAPERPVAAIAGDGGFMFTVGELAAAAELRQSLPILIWNNDGYAQIRDGMVRRGIPPVGVDSPNPDFLLLAEAFGCDRVRPGSFDEVSASMEHALSAPRPTLIEVRQGEDWLS